MSISFKWFFRPYSHFILPSQNICPFFLVAVTSFVNNPSVNSLYTYSQTCTNNNQNFRFPIHVFITLGSEQRPPVNNGHKFCGPKSDRCTQVWLYFLFISDYQKSEVCVGIAENEKYSNWIFRFFDPFAEHVGIVPAVMIHLGPLTFKTNETKLKYFKPSHTRCQFHQPSGAKCKVPAVILLRHSVTPTKLRPTLPLRPTRKYAHFYTECPSLCSP